ncbi:Crp/Fnr family transcriptional regulator [Xanthobacter sp. 126]|jgi:CRP/FNR family transcriptional regulator, dissimilatory nitrate respiration regulator|uniref:cyclic nucleotide-binding domain-containing protein n=1 Tax=Xanthobacter sp. 126 TaxID=1131814 RepID=UPI00045EBFA0
MEPGLLRPLLESLSLRRVPERSFARGEHLFRRGKAPEFMFCVLSGEARMVRHSPAGIEVVFQRARHGFLAEASLDQPAYHCDGIAAVAVCALAIPIATFREALARADIQALWLRHLSGELRRVRAQSERLALRTARERIVHFIETEGRHGVLELSQPKMRWAAELGLTHEALYRALRAMVDAGALEVSGRCLRLRPQGQA